MLIRPQTTKPISIRDRVTGLMGQVRSKARKKAIITIAKRHNVPRSQAQFIQAVSIAKSQNRKKK